MQMRIIAALLALSLLACPLWASGFNVTGKWVSTAMGAKLKVNVEQHGNKISGVAFVYPLVGKKLTYHFSGIVKGTDVFASHHQGHSFSGRLTSRGLLEGVVHTRQGHQIAISAHRR